jgi:hypothetical protein
LAYLAFFIDLGDISRVAVSSRLISLNFHILHYKKPFATARKLEPQPWLKPGRFWVLLAVNLLTAIG